MKYTKDQILKSAKEENVRYIRLMFSDIVGTIKSVEIPVGQLESALDGETMFDGSSIEGFVRIMEADMFLVPDYNTWLIHEWEHIPNGKVARLICDVYTPNGQPSEVDPRSNLKKQMKRMEKLGFASLKIGFEPEFFLFKLDKDGHVTMDVADLGGYFDLSPLDGADDCRRDIVLELEKLGFHMEASHHEVAPGQNEINFEFSSVLEACDNLQTFKLVVKNVARRHNLHATFMPKPIANINGSGMHTNCSLTDKLGNNAFYDPKDDLGLSLVARQWITGILKYSREFCALTNPTVNSYKRLVPGYEAPCYISWSEHNRSVMVRIPAARGKSTRAEIRSVDPSANPYLALSAIMAAGLEGIEKELPLIDPINKNLFDLNEDERRQLGVENLPVNLKEAVCEFENSQLMKDTMGLHIYSKFIELKTKEWECFAKTVTEWEIKKYLYTM